MWRNRRFATTRKRLVQQIHRRDMVIRLGDCDDCKNRFGFKNGHTLCHAFPEGIPYEHMEKDLKSLKECNNGIGFEPKTENND